MRISCARCLCHGFLHQDPVAPLVQDLSVRMSAPGFCRTACARSLYADLLSKISLSGSLHLDPVIPLVQDLCMRISCAYLCVRILYDHHMQDLRMRISCARSLCQDVDPVGLLVQDLFTRSCCARSLFQDLCIRISAGPLVEDALPLSTRTTISAEGSHFEAMLQKYCACHEIMSRGHTKCCTGYAKASASSSSKNATPLRN